MASSKPLQLPLHAWSLHYQADCNMIMRERGLTPPDGPVFTRAQLDAMGRAQMDGTTPEQFVDRIAHRSCVA